MLSEKLFSILLSFEKSDWTQCNAYVSSKYRDNTKERLLFDLIYKRRTNLGHKSLKRQALLDRLFADQNKTAFNNLVARLRRTIEEFIIQSELFSQEYTWERRMILAKYYKRKGLNNLFITEANGQLDQLDTISEYDLSLSLKRFQSNYEVAYSAVRLDDKMSFLLRTKDNVFSHSSEMSTLIETELLNQKKLFGRNAEVDDHKSTLLVYLERLKKLVKEQDHASYQYLKKALTDVDLGINGDLAQISLTYMINFIRFKLKQGDDFATRELLDLYVYGISSGILCNQGKLPETTFLNAIEIKSYLDQTTDHSLFLYEWLPMTETQDRVIVERIGLAYLDFGKGNFQKTLDRLNMEESSYDNFNLELRSRWLRICANYAHDPDHMHYDTVLKTQEQYFRRKEKKIGEANYKGSINLLKTIRMMWEGRSVDSIKEKIGNYDYLNCRVWVNQELKKARTR